MDFLNAREWAIVAWLLIAIVLSQLNGDLRRGGANVVKAALQPKLVAIFLVCWAYAAVCVALLFWVGLWEGDQLKTTILWALFTTPPLVSRVVKHATAPQFVRGWVSDTLTVTLVIELIALTYVFDFWVEMVLIPVLFVISGMLAVAGRDEKYKAVQRFLTTLLAIFALYLVARGIWMIVEKWGEFATLTTVRDTYVAPVLSFMAIPFLYGVYLYSAYDSAFSGMRVAIPDPKLRDYAQTMALIACHANVDQLRHWVREMHLKRPVTRDQVTQSLKLVRRTAAWADTPALVPEAEGWCPVFSRQILAKRGYATNAYHESFGEWFASSPMTEITSGSWPHNIALYLEGEERVVRRLALKLNINQREDRAEANRQFLDLAGVLLSSALPYQDTSAVRTALEKGESFETMVGTTQVELKREVFPNKQTDGYSLLLELRRSGSNVSPALEPKPA